MTNKAHIQRDLGRRLSRQRIEHGLSQSAVAAAAGISASYYSDIENSKRISPPHNTMARILNAIGFCEIEIHELERLAAKERGISPGDENLPDEAQALIKDIRRYAKKMNPRFIKGLRTKIREAVT